MKTKDRQIIVQERIDSEIYEKLLQLKARIDSKAEFIIIIISYIFLLLFLILFLYHFNIILILFSFVFLKQ